MPQIRQSVHLIRLVCSYMCLGIPQILHLVDVVRPLGRMRDHEKASIERAASGNSLTKPRLNLATKARQKVGVRRDTRPTVLGRAAGVAAMKSREVKDILQFLAFAGIE